MEQANIRAIAPWFGGKRSMAPQIAAELGEHRAYWEPFCGSMAVLFAKRLSQQETVNDQHGGLINLARVLADPSQACSLYQRASRTLYCTELYEESAAWLDQRGGQEAEGPEAAYHYLVASWMGRNGTSGSVRTNWQPSIRFTPGGGSSPTRWRAAVESIPWWHERLRNVCILRQDAFGLIPKIADEDGVALYVDPPYLATTRGTGGGSRYLHDFEEGDHERLAEMLRQFQHARVVVSYYDHPRIRQLYGKWTLVAHTRQKNLHVQNRRGIGRCEVPEVLLINGPSLADNGGQQQLRMF